MAAVRRRRQALEAAVAAAENPSAIAKARYALAIFHDNNGREASAIPHYRSAIALGLPEPEDAAAWAWLASSLWKTGAAAEAAEAIARSRALAPSPAIARFLEGLERRIDRRLRSIARPTPAGG
ncbi:MAG TPA: tetratricopeptide repeat protein [Caulobacteraceae bacterium]|nr:tetratricopeptide repeat protein [Caulobacteraceae bacterium]